MKPQDILFILVFLFLLWNRNPKYFVVAGLLFLLLSMPFFHFWVFFTAERLVLYSFICLLVGVVFLFFKK